MEMEERGEGSPWDDRVRRRRATKRGGRRKVKKR
jgi:hypothetical protein